MMTGTVSFYNRQRGWGFIIPDDLSSPDMFLHARNLPDSHKYANQGDRVSYDVGPSDRGSRPLAINARASKNVVNLGGTHDRA
jgi:cold shock protein